MSGVRTVRRSTRTALTAALVLTAPLLLGAAPPPPSAAAHVQRTVVGRSVRGRPIVLVHRWRDGATRRLLVVGNLHGDETAGRRVVRRLRRAVLPASVDLWLVPTANPDGTAARRRTNADGVDLNRNFPRLWRSAGRGTDVWSGPAPASEPETRVLMRVARSVRPSTTVVLHQPLDGVDAYHAKSLGLVRALSAATGLPVRVFDCGGTCHGTFTDWANARTPGRYVTVELTERVPDAEVSRVAAGLLRVAATGP